MAKVKTFEVTLRLTGSKWYPTNALEHGVPLNKATIRREVAYQHVCLESGADDTTLTLVKIEEVKDAR